MRTINLNFNNIAFLGNAKFNNKYVSYIMLVPKHWLMGRWHPRRLVVKEQMHRPSDSNKHVAILFSTARFWNDLH